MNDIVLSTGVRQNLLSLQSTAAQMSITQNRLATGKKVNSALDNPTSFFTSQSLLNRSSDLNSLLDQIGQAQQTLQAANQGLTSLTSLVQSAKSIANQALQASKGTVNYSSITGSVAIAQDTTLATSATSIALAGATSASAQATSHIDVAAQVATGAADDNQTLSVSLNGVTKVYTFVHNGAAAGQYSDGAALRALINTDFGAVATVGAAAANAFTISSKDVTSDFTTGGTGPAGPDLAVTNTAHTTGGTFTVSDGTHTLDFYYVAAGALPGSRTFSDATSLAAAIQASSLHTAGGPGGVVTAAANGTNPALLDLTTATGGQFTVSGTLGAAAGYAITAYSNNYNATLAGVGGNLTVQVGSNNAHTVAFGNGVGQVATRTALNAALAGFGDITGSVNSTGHLQLTSTSTDHVTTGGGAAALAAVGIPTGTNVITPTATVITPDVTRANLQTQYNNLLTQIDQLSRDASYNGINLLNGDTLKVTFNETNTSFLSIQGVTFNSQGLGLTQVVGNGFQDNGSINTTISAITTALTTLRTQSAQFGSTLSTVQTRQDFTKNLVNVLQVGSDNLVLADGNEEGANMLALQTRQQLSTTALSLANQASQAVLRLFQ
jgi:flagellin-like hook-associated protein FlgL